MSGPKSRTFRRPPEPVLVGVAIALVLGTVGLALLGYRASQAWRTSAAMLVENRTEEIAALLTSAITKDMRSAQESTLIPMQATLLFETPPFELSDIFSRSFARFPYPESFFVWRTADALLFNRSDRPPPWQKKSAGATFPVMVERESEVARRLGDQSREYVVPGAEFALFETVIGEDAYQVVARLFYEEKSRRPVAIVGFTVNLRWVREHYFSELIDQTQRLAGNGQAGSFAVTISDGNGNNILRRQTRKLNGPVREKHFPFLFFDSSLVAAESLSHVPIQQWSVRVDSADDPLLEAADNGATRTFILIAITAAVSIIGLLVAVHSLRAKFELAAMKEDFVAMVSHELKTPLAGIGLIGDTLAKRRYNSDAVISDYGALLSSETSRLKKLVENLLTFSRMTDRGTSYVVATVDLRDALNEALTRFKPQICEMDFELSCHLPDQPCNIRGDREAIIQMIENIIDNALKYSEDTRRIKITVEQSKRGVALSIADRGKGILQDDLPYVFTKFYRGKNAGVDGSGLGLSVVQQIVKDHGGTVEIQSVQEHGTSVTLMFPA